MANEATDIATVRRIMKVSDTITGRAGTEDGAAVRRGEEGKDQGTGQTCSAERSENGRRNSAEVRSGNKNVAGTDDQDITKTAGNAEKRSAVSGE